MYQYVQEERQVPRSLQQVRYFHNSSRCISHLVIIIIPIVVFTMMAAIDDHQYQFQYVLPTHSASLLWILIKEHHYIHIYYHGRHQRRLQSCEEVMTALQVYSVGQRFKNGWDWDLPLPPTPLR